MLAMAKRMPAVKDNDAEKLERRNLQQKLEGKQQQKLDEENLEQNANLLPMLLLQDEKRST